MPLADPNSSLHQLQDELARTTRLYAMLSQINRAIVRSEDPQYLFASICRIAVDHGGFSLAWVGLSEPNSARVALVAHAGEASLILKMHLMATATGTERQSPASRAILDGQPCVANYLLADSQLHAIHREIASHNLQAAASFPLRLEGKIIGAFTVAATSPGYFTDKELRLLTEVADDISFALGVMRREEQRSIAESKMQYLAYYDGQTGLPSHVLFESRLFEIARMASTLGILAISLTRFHGALQALGQEYGAEISRLMASKLESALNSGFVARVAESQFVVLLDNFKSISELEDAARLVYRAMAEVIVVQGREIYLEPYVGIAHYPQHGPVHTLLNHAMLAANMKPREAGSVYRFFAPHMEEAPKHRHDLENALRRALKQKEFALYYQPQLDLVSGRLIGAEALIRWMRPGHGVVSPLEFIPLLEENGMIWDVGEWAMLEACRTNRRWQDQGLPPIRMAVNLSARQFQNGDIHGMVKQVLETTRLDPQWLELELTEGIVLLNADSVIRTMKSLAAIGVSHALDDFGTGYSSLSYLQRLPVERIKIDRSFVSDITTNPADAAIARAVVGMAHSLNMTVIAEGVETEAQLGYLRSLGCEEMQGYLFSRPLPESEFAALLKSGQGIKPAPRAAAERVLLFVSSERNAQQHMMRIVERENTLLVYAATPADAFERMATCQAGVVLCDQELPQMTGIEFLKRTGELYPHVIRMVISQTLEMNAMIEAVNSGTIYKFFAKPWNEALVTACLRDAFRLSEITRQNRELASRVECLDSGRDG